MKRTLCSLDKTKWYHEGTLLKFFENWTVSRFNYTCKEGIVFNFIVFRNPGRRHTFIIHPKTKRLRYSCDSTFAEMGIHF